MKKLPNILSITRVLLALILLIVYSNNDLIRFNVAIALIIVISLTDYFDGKLARIYHNTSTVGYVLDGLGDRAVHLSLFMIFFAENRISIVLLWLVIFREVSIYAVRILHTEWTHSKELRKISLLYVVLIRLWFLLNIGSDGAIIYWKEYINISFYLTILLVIACCISYFGLYKYLETMLKKGNK